MISFHLRSLQEPPIFMVRFVNIDRTADGEVATKRIKLFLFSSSN